MASAVLHIVVELITFFGYMDVLGIDFLNVCCRER